jgi:hypothetical protein
MPDLDLMEIPMAELKFSIELTLSELERLARFECDRAVFLGRVARIAGTIASQDAVARANALFEELRDLVESAKVAALVARVPLDRPGDMASVYANENGCSYEQALVACNID